ncbi:MAG TPA: hypothetical protein EYH41_15625 [Novosphingobium capsulatum]|jgi:hypothetical protein|nr:hypothetical protein [Novosphingobium capsulatum]
MTTAPFFTTRLGRAALISIAAMAAMNVVVVSRHMPDFPDLTDLAPHAAVSGPLAGHAGGITASVAAITGGVA